MSGSDVLSLALLGYIAWRERAHALERQGLLSRRGGGRPPAAVAVGRKRRGKAERPKVISAEDDSAFNEARGDVAEDEGDET